MHDQQTKFIKKLFQIAENCGSRVSPELLKCKTAAPFAEAVFVELVSRMPLFHGPKEPIVVQFDLRIGRQRLGYAVKAIDAGGAMTPGWAHDPRVTIRQDLIELVQLVFGPGGPPRNGTREIFRQEQPVTSLSALGSSQPHPGNVDLALSQVVQACAGYQGPLAKLAVQFGSDKWGRHWYAPLYERHFGPFREGRIKILEIGVGGYQFPHSGGASLKMWKHFFRRGLVYGLDVFDKSDIDEPRLRTFRGNQSDARFLHKLARNIGPFDIIVDDGSHLSPDVTAAFRALFPHLRPGGIYVIEDLQTSYWPGWAGDSKDLNNLKTSMGFLKNLVDGLHYQERLTPKIYKPSFSDLAVTAVHFYHNIAFIEKGVNTEQSAPAWISRTKSPYSCKAKIPFFTLHKPHKRPRRPRRS
jgi:hypothetical protein